jgi:peptide/nickel transport system permease protein
MLRFLGRRLAFILFVSVLIVFFAHMGMRMVRNSETSSPLFDVRSVAKLAWVDTRSYVASVSKGNLGLVEREYGLVQVKDLLGEAYINSMGLLMVALIASTLAGVLIGGITALIKYRKLVLPLLTITILGISTPSFVAAILLQQAELHYMQTFGRRLVRMAGFGWDFEHMLMPVLVLSARPLAYITRATFLALRRIMAEDFIRTAYSKGLSRLRTVIVHAFRILAIPALTSVGISLRFSLSSLPVVEMFFEWPGMGRRLIQAINSRETTLVVSLALALGLTFMLTNLILDIIFRFVDPRLREIDEHV